MAQITAGRAHETLACGIGGILGDPHGVRDGEPAFKTGRDSLLAKGEPRQSAAAEARARLDRCRDSSHGNCTGGNEGHNRVYPVICGHRGLHGGDLRVAEGSRRSFPLYDLSRCYLGTPGY